MTKKEKEIFTWILERSWEKKANPTVIAEALALLFPDGAEDVMKDLEKDYEYPTEEEIIDYFKGTLFYKQLEDYEVKTVLTIINTYKYQKREVLILKIAELIIKWKRLQTFY